MTLIAGSRLGPYEVIAAIGAGGMGEVYRARDTRLDRAVALKVIAGLAASAPDIQQRFEREARTISQLNHPHICALYDVGREAPAGAAVPVDFLVMELIEGETLAARLERGALPVEQALRIAIQIADALAAAHRRGIVHRDLKPGNIMLTKAGAKLLDFGLARSVAPAVAPGASALPTTPANLTAQGTILGTFQYMAPEQLEGQEADARADIFSFGTVLYEMITGRLAFEGRSHAALISAIMGAEPPRVTAVQPLAPPMLDYAVSRCLAKDPDERWQSAQDLGAELRRIAGLASGIEPPVSGAAPAVARRRRVPLAWGVAALMTLAAAGLAGWSAVGPRPPAGPLHLAIPLAPADGLGGRFALSPDGQRLAFVGLREGRPHLFVRALGSPEATLLTSAPIGAGGPVFSPDGRWIAFAVGGKLWKIAVAGGTPIQLAGGATGRPAWGANGIIVFENTRRGLSSVPEGGGEPAVVTEPGSAPELAHYAPWLMPDGRTLLYTVRRSDSDWDQGLELVAQPLAGGARTRLADGASPIYLASGHLVFERAGTVYAGPFDARALRFTADPEPIVENLASQLTNPLLSVAQNGTVAYVSARDSGIGAGLLTLVDPHGVSKPLPFPPQRYADPRLSPDGRRVAVHIFEEGRENYVADLERGTLMRLTVDPGEDETPVWTPDSRAIVYTSTRTNHERAIFRRMADGSAAEELLWTGKGHAHLGGFTPDGRTLVLAMAEQSHFDLMTLTIGETTLAPLLATRANETEPALSPDGRWLAYVSDETGRAEVYVQPYPKLDGRWPISTTGGREPVWSRDGRRLYYRAGGKLMAVEVTATPAFSVSAPAPLFDDPFLSTMGEAHTCYDATPDGRLLMVARAGGGDGQPVHVKLMLNAVR
jgi:eukaryotic-like serine/threonine-protein kinase